MLAKIKQNFNFSFLEINPLLIWHYNDVASRGDVRLVAYMLDTGIQIDCRNENVFTALEREALNNHTDIVDVLLQKGADLDEESDVACWTLLDDLVCYNPNDIMRDLLLQGVEHLLKEAMHLLEEH